MNRIVKKDKVKIISGKFKGKEGVVKKILVKEQKCVIEGINKVKRFQKNEDPSKRIIEKEMPLHLSKIALIDSKSKDSKLMKVSYVVKEGIKIRINKKTKEV